MELTESATRALEHWAEHYNHEIEVLAEKKEKELWQLYLKQEAHKKHMDNIRKDQLAHDELVRRIDSVVGSDTFFTGEGISARSMAGRVANSLGKYWLSSSAVYPLKRWNICGLCPTAPMRLGIVHFEENRDKHLVLSMYYPTPLTEPKMFFLRNTGPKSILWLRQRLKQFGLDPLPTTHHYYGDITTLLETYT